MVAAEGALPRQVPNPAGVRRVTLAVGRHRRFAHGSAPRRLLPRQLLGTDAAAVCSRRDEFGLGGCAELACAVPETSPPWRVDRAGERRRYARRRNISNRCLISMPWKSGWRRWLAIP